MNDFLLHLADGFFMIFHAAFTVFNALGWIWKKTRKLNLVTLMLTVASWFLLGIFYGIGYCPLTEYHFQVLYRLGHEDLPHSYIQYVIERMTGFSPDPDLTGIVTAAVLFTAVALSLFLNIRDWRSLRNKA